ncbi:hypothetical protein GCM10012285_53440 [Streptomyces kronopolitis]|uniref:Uncharacterized protein n=1 Tax=Streptomyces kronopolitis TaxID=1612435 RepID=A0ABQ2JXX8_9ACTN|nr:hypothetical protein GCM10012285_53440 [Streptomyces kronopolitis]
MPPRRVNRARVPRGPGPSAFSDLARLVREGPPRGPFPALLTARSRLSEVNLLRHHGSYGPGGAAAAAKSGHDAAMWPERQLFWTTVRTPPRMSPGVGHRPPGGPLPLAFLRRKRPGVLGRPIDGAPPNV